MVCKICLAIISVHHWSQVTWEMSDTLALRSTLPSVCLSVLNLSLKRTFFYSTRSHQGHDVFLLCTQMHLKSANMCAPVFLRNVICASIISRKWHYRSAWFFIANPNFIYCLLKKKRKNRWKTSEARAKFRWM